MKNWFALIFLLVSSVCWGNEDLKPLIAPDVISKKIKEVALKIDKAYQGEPVTVVMVMKGAICVTADLIRNLHMPVTLEYLQANTYGDAHGSKGKIKLTTVNKFEVTGKNILVVDDIFDSGKTMVAIIKQLQEKKPKSLKSLVLLTKKPSKKSHYYPNYALFDLNKLMSQFPNNDAERIVVGYGIDYEDNYRELPGIYIYTKQANQ